MTTTTSDTDRRRVPYGVQAMSFTIQPCGRDGHPINGGNHYANAATLFGARAIARGLLDRPDFYLGHRVESVSISGGMYEFAGSAWRPVFGPDMPRHGETIRPEDLRSVAPVTVTGEFSMHADWDEPVRTAGTILAAPGEIGAALREMDKPRRATVWAAERARDWNGEVFDSVTFTAEFNPAGWRGFAELCGITTDDAGHAVGVAGRSDTPGKPVPVTADRDGFGFTTEYRTAEAQWAPAHAEGLRAVRLHVRFNDGGRAA